MRALFRDRLFNKHYDKLIEDRKTKRPQTSINTISSITILAQAKDHSYVELEKGPGYFRHIGIACDLYVIVDKGDEIKNIPGMRTIDVSECEWYGIPSQEILIKWLSNKTDLLIVSQPDGLLMKYLCAASNSKLKASMTIQGRSNDDMDIDLWIDSGEKREISLLQQCRITYETLTKLGIRPPVIG